MDNKGFTEIETNIETPNDNGFTEKPLKSNGISSNRVDINVLKSKLQETENKEFKKNKQSRQRLNWICWSSLDITCLYSK